MILLLQARVKDLQLKQPQQFGLGKASKGAQAWAQRLQATAMRKQAQLRGEQAS